MTDPLTSDDLVDLVKFIDELVQLALRSETLDEADMEKVAALKEAVRSYPF